MMLVVASGVQGPVRASRYLVAGGVMLTGLCAAWPFRETYRSLPTPAPLAAPLELTLRRPDSPLVLAPRSDISPAVGIEPQSAGLAPSGASTRTSLRTGDLADLTPPPALPVSFQPGAANPPPSDWRPEPTARPTGPPPRPRPYRLRDGDTLEKIAERLLGDSGRAGEVFEANRDVLMRPDLLPVGTTIVLPPRERSDDLEPVHAER